MVVRVVGPGGGARGYKAQGHLQLDKSWRPTWATRDLFSTPKTKQKQLKFRSSHSFRFYSNQNKEDQAHFSKTFYQSWLSTKKFCICFDKLCEFWLTLRQMAVWRAILTWPLLCCCIDYPSRSTLPDPRISRSIYQPTICCLSLSLSINWETQASWKKDLKFLEKV